MSKQHISDVAKIVSDLMNNPDLMDIKVRYTRDSEYKVKALIDSNPPRYEEYGPNVDDPENGPGEFHSVSIEAANGFPSKLYELFDSEEL